MYILFGMACVLCKKSSKGALLHLSCGHCVHLDCLRESDDIWECPHCASPMMHAQFDGGDWYVGICGTETMYSFYKINTDNKLIPFYKRRPMWYRTNGRLTRCDLLNLKHKICIF